MELHHLRLLKPGSLKSKAGALGHSKSRDRISHELEKVSLLLVHEIGYFGVFDEKHQSTSVEDIYKKREHWRKML